MMRLYVRLLERSLRPEVAAHVVGDLVEQRQRGHAWLLREGLWWWIVTVLIACAATLLRETSTARWLLGRVGRGTVQPAIDTRAPLG